MSDFIEKEEDFTQKILENLNYATSKNQYVIFQILDKFFAISIDYIQEFIEYKKVTSLPDSFEFIQGMINYRGRTIAVIDLKKRINESSYEGYSKHSILIIIKFKDEFYGILSDNIIDIVSFDEDKINKNIDLITKIEKKLIKATYNYNDNIVMILEIDNLLN